MDSIQRNSHRKITASLFTSLSLYPICLYQICFQGGTWDVVKEFIHTKMRRSTQPGKTLNSPIVWQFSIRITKEKWLSLSAPHAVGSKSGPAALTSRFPPVRRPTGECHRSIGSINKTPAIFLVVALLWWCDWCWSFKKWRKKRKMRWQGLMFISSADYKRFLNIAQKEIEDFDFSKNGQLIWAAIAEDLYWTWK